MRPLGADANFSGQIQFICYLLSLRGHWRELSAIIDPTVSRKPLVVIQVNSFQAGVK